MDPDLADTWAQAYGLVAKVMVAAAEQHEEIAPAAWEADVVSVERRSVEVAVIEVAPRQEFPYRAGQSVAVEVPQRPRLWRYFSPANAPQPSGRMQFHVQPIDGGLVSTAVVRRLSQGDTIRLAAPVGEQLTLPENEQLPDLLMVAGGTGLAPLRAVLEQIDRGWEATGSAPLVHLFHGSRMPWNLYDHEHLTRLARKPWFAYTAVVSDDPTTAPEDLSVRWLRRPTTGRGVRPWCAVRRVWFGTPCTSSRQWAFRPRRFGASSLISKVRCHRSRS